MIPTQFGTNMIVVQIRYALERLNGFLDCLGEFKTIYMIRQQVD
jgi:hypothetical protein